MGNFIQLRQVRPPPLTLGADHARLEGPIGVNDVHEGSRLLGDYVLGQLGDSINIGTVNKPGACWVQSCFEIF